MTGGGLVLLTSLDASNGDFRRALSYLLYIIIPSSSRLCPSPGYATSAEYCCGRLIVPADPFWGASCRTEQQATYDTPPYPLYSLPLPYYLT